jgi:hypothetical protein
MEERERCYSFILSRTPHETNLVHDIKLVCKNIVHFTKPTVVMSRCYKVIIRSPQDPSLTACHQIEFKIALSGGFRSQLTDLRVRLDPFRQ